MRLRFALWAYHRWAYPRLVGYIWRPKGGSEVYMINPKEMEKVYG